MVQTVDELAYALNDTLHSRRGNVVIPSFAVGRTQDLLYLISELCRQGRVPSHDLYVDSPMALAATRITLRHSALHDRETTNMTQWLKGGHGAPRVHFTESVEDSMKINQVRAGATIISASGMCEGGRIRHHLRWNIARPECAIVFVGFQAKGTLGRSIVDGARTVRIFGEEYPVRARIFTIGGLSAHADQASLLKWLGNFRNAPAKTWLVHGEVAASESLRDAISKRLHWNAEVPKPGQAYTIQ
jgi:metallo-beta-lactamase family protein